MEIFRSTLLNYKGLLWSFIEEHSSASTITVKIAGNLGPAWKHGVDVPIEILVDAGKAGRTYTLVVTDESRKAGIVSPLCVPKTQTAFLLSFPDLESLVISKNSALGRLYIKRPVSNLKYHIGICHSCYMNGRNSEQMIYLREERYATQSFFLDVNVHNYDRNLVPEGKILYHARETCLQSAFTLPSCTKQGYEAIERSK